MLTGIKPGSITPREVPVIRRFLHYLDKTGAPKFNLDEIGVGEKLSDLIETKQALGAKLPHVDKQTWQMTDGQYCLKIPGSKGILPQRLYSNASSHTKLYPVQHDEIGRNGRIVTRTFFDKDGKIVEIQLGNYNKGIRIRFDDGGIKVFTDKKTGILAPDYKKIDFQA